MDLTGFGWSWMHLNGVEWIWMALNGFYDFQDTTFYSDSINDLPLLKEVENPIAVNPDNTLRQESLNRSWEIIDLP